MVRKIGIYALEIKLARAGESFNTGVEQVGEEEDEICVFHLANNR